jgi:hypothetical protein
MTELASWNDTATRRAIVEEKGFHYPAGTGRSLEAAALEGWIVVSIKNDWSTVFAGAPS